MARRKYSREFKAEAAALVLERGLSASQVARDLGVGQPTISRWVKAAQEAAAPGALSVADREELKRLRAETKTLRMERGILKNAAVDSDGRCNMVAYDPNWRVDATQDVLRVGGGGNLGKVGRWDIHQRHREGVLPGSRHHPHLPSLPGGNKTQANDASESCANERGAGEHLPRPGGRRVVPGHLSGTRTGGIHGVS